MIVYDSCGIYVQSQTTLEAKLTAIDNVIDALILSGATMAVNDNIQEYSLNDGQTIIKTIYKGSVGIANAIKYWESIRQMYLNRLHGRMVRLVDGKNFNRRFIFNGRYW